MESSASGSGESQTQKRSVIWMHFTNISEANAKSNLCKNIYSHKNGNISNLRKHLKTKHPTLSLEGERAKRRVEDENMPRCKRNLVSAFDLVHELLLLPKLDRYGIRRLPVQWFHDYLTDRQHYAQINDRRSNRCGTELGVPQRSVRGPLLYIIFVRTSVSQIKSSAQTIHRFLSIQFGHINLNFDSSFLVISLRESIEHVSAKNVWEYRLSDALNGSDTLTKFAIKLLQHLIVLVSCDF
ncbi:unnamed protein product [Acanthoscelides obtectus]|uniref:BED-type domain-containing protein n=1 Tax=Acanthoscelides obtectus TaxID=200917 RepID=A0A9P0PC01_ACAOB|nr:unnamed protein product [Acanthoscelides obtectus]CAK1641789.1 hypothetical protein AOBTE_LOCUS12631 [Acanthoscelides obtectus]